MRKSGSIPAILRVCMRLLVNDEAFGDDDSDGASLHSVRELLQSTTATATAAAASQGTFLKPLPRNRAVTRSLHSVTSRARFVCDVARSLCKWHHMLASSVTACEAPSA